MKSGESLFEFMPYGAPELLQCRRERLVSALLFSSLATALGEPDVPVVTDDGNASDEGVSGHLH